MPRSRVILLRGKKLRTTDLLDKNSIRRMIQRGFELLLNDRDPRETLRSLFGGNDRIGIKVNTIGGKLISTRPDLSLPFADWLIEHGQQEKNILIWDRTNRELQQAGYRLSLAQNRLKIFGTDTNGAGYGREPLVHLSVGSLFSSLQTDFATASISLAILKDHGLAGITAGMKNYFGAIHNPNKYHDSHCDPFVAEVFDTEPVKKKHRLSVLDCLVVQYHRGPSYHPQWAARYGGMIFSRDPVAADRVGWALIENLRAVKGLPSLKEEDREPSYILTAEKMGLGQADLSQIDVLEEEIP